MALNTWLEELRQKNARQLKRQREHDLKHPRPEVRREAFRGPLLADAKFKIGVLLPLSKSATAAQARVFQEVFEIGCIACRIDDENRNTPPEIHHVKEYGYRNHDKVYGLCPAHHKDTSKIPGTPNRHGTPKEFAAKYGTDQELFEMCNKLRGVE